MRRVETRRGSGVAGAAVPQHGGGGTAEWRSFPAGTGGVGGGQRVGAPEWRFIPAGTCGGGGEEAGRGPSLDPPDQPQPVRDGRAGGGTGKASGVEAQDGLSM